MRVLGGGISGAQLTGGPASGGLILSDPTDHAFVLDIPIPCDGAAHPLDPFVGNTSPPVWLDPSNGKIILPGLYSIYAGFNIAAGHTPTSTGLFLNMTGIFGFGFGVGLDGAVIDGGTHLYSNVFESGAISGLNVPYGTSVIVTMPSDLTGEVNLIMTIYRQAYPA